MDKCLCEACTWNYLGKWYMVIIWAWQGHGDTVILATCSRKIFMFFRQILIFCRPPWMLNYPNILIRRCHVIYFFKELFSYAFIFMLLILSLFFLFMYSQSDHFFNALKGHGALCRSVILPFENHGYSARKSILHVLWETDRWLQTYRVNNSDKLADGDAPKTDALEDFQQKIFQPAEASLREKVFSRMNLIRAPRSLLW